MPNIVKILRSTTAAAVPASLVSGQIAVNEKDGKFFWLDSTSATVKSFTALNLDTTLSGKLTAASNLSDLSNAATARTNLGLGTAAVAASTDFAAASHNHNAANITSGTLADARLPARLGTSAYSIGDWNTATLNGWYMGYNATNAPQASVWFIGLVEVHNGLWITQTIHAFAADGSTNTNAWRRSCNNGTWESWYKLQLSQAEQDARYAIAANNLSDLTNAATARTNLGLSTLATTTPGTGVAAAIAVAKNAANGLVGLDGTGKLPAVDGSLLTGVTSTFANGSVTPAKMSTGGPSWDTSGNLSVAGNVSMDASFFRNKLANGGMAIDQRSVGAAKTITAGAALAYTVDRWYAYCTGANVTGQRVQGAAANLFRFQFTGAASVSAIGFGQRIEAANSADLAGKTATLSVDLANSLLTSVTWTAYYANTADTFGSLAVPTRTQIATGTFTVNSTVTRYTTQITVPAAATTGIEIVFTVGAQTSGTWTIGDAQLESGSIDTPFERRSIGEELSRCQRYFQWVNFGILFYAPVASASIYHAMTFATPMRASPTVSNLTADGNTTQAVANNSANNFTAITPYGAVAYLTAAAIGNCYVTGYRSSATSEL